MVGQRQKHTNGNRVERRGWAIAWAFLMMTATLMTLSTLIGCATGQLATGSEIQAELFKPNGAGPFPVVVLLHGCSGFDQVSSAKLRDWTTWFANQGIATFVVDSLSTHGRTPGEGNCQMPVVLRFVATRVQDVHAAVAYLKALSGVDPNRIAVMGFSQGATTAVEYAYTGGDTEIPVVAFYPYCAAFSEPTAQVAPVQIIIGEFDDWTFARNCQLEAEVENPNLPIGHQIELHVMPGAYHSFDDDYAGRWYSGHWLAYNAEATAQSRLLIKDFLKRYWAP